MYKDIDINVRICDCRVGWYAHRSVVLVQYCNAAFSRLLAIRGYKR